MDVDEIKMEYQQYEVCVVCLSVGRKLSPLQQYKDLFRLITSCFESHKYLSLDDVLLCWECHAVLRKISLFQAQARTASDMLLVGQMYVTLSHLTTVILNDTHQAVYVDDVSLRAHINDDASGDHHVYDDEGDESSKVEQTIKEDKDVKPKKTNRWAKQRALINKQPKFKILTDYKDEKLKKIQITNEELLLSMTNEKESEYFKSKKFKCTKCALVFKDEDSLGKHNKRYHCKLGVFTCDICGSKLSNKRHLVRHIRQHYHKYQCALCEFASRDPTQLRAHAQRKHKKIFQCLSCELKFGSRKEFFKHYKEWHEKYVCDVCGTSFKMRYCIEEHIRKQHSPFECAPCNKRFARYSGLWLHNKTAHGSGSGAYCVECDRQYPDVYRYRWHLSNSAAHRKMRKLRIPCPGCDKIFSKKIYMKDHYNLVHLKCIKHRCEKCDKNFIRNADLVKHTRRVHDGVQPPRDKVCYVCGRGFETNKILAGHVRTHTNEKQATTAPANILTQNSFKNNLL